MISRTYKQTVDIINEKKCIDQWKWTQYWSTHRYILCKHLETAENRSQIYGISNNISEIDGKRAAFGAKSKKYW